MTDIATKAMGYQTATVIARIMDMDVDAQGNAEKAAWKRYLALILLAYAKGVDKKVLIQSVFGKGGKASKTFQNMSSMAKECRFAMLGNRAWSDIAAMGIEEAMTETFAMINRHMTTLGVAGKNEYAKVCHLSPAEAEAMRKAEAEADATAKAEAAEAAEAAKAEGKEAEATAKAEADAKPERTPAEAAIGVLHDASRDDMRQVMAFIAGRMSIGDLAEMRDELAAIVANAEAIANAKIAAMVAGKAA